MAKKRKSTNPVPFVNVAKRVLTIFFLLDCSSSMEDDGRIQRLNDAIPTTVESLKGLLEENPNLAIKIKTIKFSTDAEWHIGGAAGIEIDNFTWLDLEANGVTATAKAVNLLCDQLDIEKMPRRGYPPVCVMISDGFCTDPQKDYEAAIEKLNKLPWGRKAARLVIAIGNETEYDEESLRMFVNDKGSFVKCEDSSKIVEYVRLKTTEATMSASETKGIGDNNAPAPNGDGGDDEAVEVETLTPPNPDEAW